LHKKDKEEIALLAFELIEDGDIIYLDSGTTCTKLMELIFNRKIIIVTSNTAILQHVDTLVAEVIFLGGKLNDSLSSVSGSLTNTNISIFNSLLAQMVPMLLRGLLPLVSLKPIRNSVL